MEKILCDEQIETIVREHGYPVFELNEEGEEDRKKTTLALLQAQLDAAVAHYEPLLEQAKADFGLSVHEAAWRQARQEVARDIFEEIEAELVAFEYFSQKTQHQAAIINTNWYQSLKSKYTGRQK